MPFPLFLPLILVMLNKLRATPTSNFQPIRLLNWSSLLIQIHIMTNSADPDRLLQKPTDLSLHCLQRKGISGFNRTRVNIRNKCIRFMIEHRHFSNHYSTNWWFAHNFAINTHSWYIWWRQDINVCVKQNLTHLCRVDSSTLLFGPVHF